MASLFTTACVVSNSLFTVAATISIALRFAARKICGLQWQADDYILIFSLLMCYGLMGMTAAGVAIGGVNTTKLEPDAATILFAKILWIDVLFIIPALASVKIGLLMFYKRVFGAIHRFRTVCNIMIGLVTIWALGCLMAQCLVARPISTVWTPGPPTRPLINYPAYVLASLVSNLIFDIMILCLPIPVISNLNMEKKSKWKIVSVFWLGAFCVIAAAMRIYTTYRSANSSHSADPAIRIMVSRNPTLWNRVEPCASIIAACLPTFGAFVQARRSKSQRSNTAFYPSSSRRNRTEEGDSREGQSWYRLRDTSDRDSVMKELQNDQSMGGADGKGFEKGSREIGQGHAIRVGTRIEVEVS